MYLPRGFIALLLNKHRPFHITPKGEAIKSGFYSIPPRKPDAPGTRGAPPALGGPECTARRHWPVFKPISLPAMGRPPGKPNARQGQAPRCRTLVTAQPQALLYSDSKVSPNRAGPGVGAVALAICRGRLVRQSHEGIHLPRPEKTVVRSQRDSRVALGGLRTWAQPTSQPVAP